MAHFYTKDGEVDFGKNKYYFLVLYKEDEMRNRVIYILITKVDCFSFLTSYTFL